MTSHIILAGATGDLGARIADYLIKANVSVTALVRKDSSKKEATKILQNRGVNIAAVDYNNEAELIKACSGGTCVVSALSGLEDVIVDTQTKLLNAAVKAEVPRFIPSDFCIDYTKLPEGSNRNLDLRRRFNGILDAAPIKATSIFNGMFTDLLTGQAPVVLFPIKRILYWDSADQLLDFTTTDNTAQYTALAAVDDNAPRHLRIAGEVTNAKGLQQTASEVTGKPFSLLRPGGLAAFATLIKITRILAPQKEEVFPAWQGMQYMHNMFSGLPRLNPLDNDRYAGMRWTTVKEILLKSIKQDEKA